MLCGSIAYNAIYYIHLNNSFWTSFEINKYCMLHWTSLSLRRKNIEYTNRQTLLQMFQLFCYANVLNHVSILIWLNDPLWITLLFFRKKLLLQKEFLQFFNLNLMTINPENNNLTYYLWVRADSRKVQSISNSQRTSFFAAVKISSGEHIFPCC